MCLWGAHGQCQAQCQFPPPQLHQGAAWSVLGRALGSQEWSLFFLPALTPPHGNWERRVVTSCRSAGHLVHIQILKIKQAGADRMGRRQVLSPHPVPRGYSEQLWAWAAQCTGHWSQS